jgi:hypothetical protein
MRREGLTNKGLPHCEAPLQDGQLFRGIENLINKGLRLHIFSIFPMHHRLRTEDLMNKGLRQQLIPVHRADFSV